MSAYHIGSPLTAYTNGFTSPNNGASNYMNGNGISAAHNNGLVQAHTTTRLHSHANSDASSYRSTTTNEVMTLWGRYEHLKNEGVRKDVLIEEVITRYSTLSNKYADLKQKLEQEFAYQGTQSSQQRVITQKAEIDHLQGLLNRDPYVLLLIDGDGMIFDERYLRNGEKGGRQAAADLREEVAKWVPNGMIEAPKEYRVVVRVYANVKGLADVCVRAGIIPSRELFEDFTRGFTRGHTLFDFIDVGSGKDRADAKINENFKLSLWDFHCRQLVLGCSHDNGYTRLLEDYSVDPAAKARVTLLEGVPFEKELLELPFKTLKFSDIFRSSKINISPPDLLTGTFIKPDLHGRPLNAASGAFTPRTATPGTTFAQTPRLPQLEGNLPAPSPATPRKSSVASSGASSDNTLLQSSWARRAHAAAGLPQTSVAPAQSAVPMAVARHNKKGQRIDPPLEYDIGELTKVKKIKMCNQHYLNDHGCPKSGKCGHRHDYNPSPAELKLLKSVARETPCKRGTSCDEPGCIYGHKCPFPMATEGSSRGIGCLMGDGCRFPREMHGITDFAPIKYTKITGAF